MLTIRQRMLALVVVAFQLGVYYGHDFAGTPERVLSLVALIVALILIVDYVARRPWKRH